MTLAQRIERNWYSHSVLGNLWLLPVWLLAAPFIYIKWWCARRNPAETLATPVVVIGNITVGGTGKTPLITYLVERVREMGFEAGVISRGYGGTQEDDSAYPLIVGEKIPAQVCGDEPKLLSLRLDCPVAVDPQRKRAAQLLNDKVDIIFSDDGLQHYALGRDAELLVVDGQRGYGNGWLLPLGPLREPVSRQDSVDLVLKNGDDFSVTAVSVVNAKNGKKEPLSWLQGQRFHAVAGIGNPKRFYDSARSCGAELIEHSFADHYQFVASDLCFDDELPVLMTEKDWVKCTALATDNMWYLAVNAEPREEIKEQIDQVLLKLLTPQRFI